MPRCYIGLGANLAEPVAQLQAALATLQQASWCQQLRCSALYSSKPMGPQDQPDYVNAVAEFVTELTPSELLSQLQQIEQTQGRQRKADRWGPRTLDLDILLYGELQIDSPTLIVPHYGMAVREFVLYPLAELAPDLWLPKYGALQQLLRQVPLNGLSPIASAWPSQTD